MQIKTTLRFHLTPIRTAIIKNTITNVGKDGGKEPLYTAGGDEISITTMENSAEFPQKTKTRIAR
jgi:hypothetical protein